MLSELKEEEEVDGVHKDNWFNVEIRTSQLTRMNVNTIKISEKNNLKNQPHKEVILKEVKIQRYGL